MRTSATSTWQTRALAIGIAVVVNIVVLLIARLIEGEFPSAETAGEVETIGVVPVLFATLFTGLLGWGLLTILERVTAKGPRLWLIIAVAVAVLSLVGPLVNGDDTYSIMVLLLLHVTTALVIIPTMWRSATQQRV